MTDIELKEVITELLGTFYAKRLEHLSSIDLFNIYSNNFFLLYAHQLGTASNMVETTMQLIVAAADHMLFEKYFYSPLTLVIARHSENTTSQQKLSALEYHLVVLNANRIDVTATYWYRVAIARPSRTIDANVAGERRWRDLTGEADFHLRIAQAIGNSPSLHYHQYQSEWSKRVNILSLEFYLKFHFADGSMDWNKLLTACEQTQATSY